MSFTLYILKINPHVNPYKLSFSQWDIMDKIINFSEILQGSSKSPWCPNCLPVRGRLQITSRKKTTFSTPLSQIFQRKKNLVFGLSQIFLTPLSPPKAWRNLRTTSYTIFYFIWPRILIELVISIVNKIRRNWPLVCYGSYCAFNWVYSLLSSSHANSYSKNIFVLISN